MINKIKKAVDILPYSINDVKAIKSLDGWSPRMRDVAVLDGDESSTVICAAEGLVLNQMLTLLKETLGGEIKDDTLVIKKTKPTPQPIPDKE